MRMRHAAVVAGLALGLMSGTAKAAYILDIDQVSGNVVATGSGSIDTTQLNPGGSTFGADYLDPSSGSVLIGNYDGTTAYLVLFFSGIVGPSSFGNSPSIVGAFNTGTGNNVGILGSLGVITLPLTYVTGTQLGISTATAFNTTLADFGLTAGTTAVYSFPTGTEGMDTFTIKVGVSPVPLPASAPMFGAALLALGAIGYGVKRKKAAAAA